MRADKRRKSSHLHFSSAAIDGCLPKIFLPAECHGLPPLVASASQLAAAARILFLEAKRFRGRRQSGGGSHWRPSSEDNLEA